MKKLFRLSHVLTPVHTSKSLFVKALLIALILHGIFFVSLRIKQNSTSPSFIFPNLEVEVSRKLVEWQSDQMSYSIPWPKGIIPSVENDEPFSSFKSRILSIYPEQNAALPQLPLDAWGKTTFHLLIEGWSGKVLKATLLTTTASLSFEKWTREHVLKLSFPAKPNQIIWSQEITFEVNESP